MQKNLTPLLFLLAASPVFAQPKFPFFEPVQPPRAVQIMAHRGMHMLAPENSLAAILACGADYIEWAEIDVRLTKDGRHVIVHDDSVDRCSDGKGKVAELTLEELQKLDAGSWFARRFKGAHLVSLAEMLAAAKGKVNLYLDCKQVDPELLVKEIIAAEMAQQVIVFGPPELLAKVAAFAERKIPIMTKFRPKGKTVEALVRDLDPAAVEIDAEDVTPELCKALREMGVKV